ncbi:thioredoxin domain-containing protein, partial [Acinetobacter baumannii]|nr:thioredoxin domain-containing protein [Acinetobacter baumannii]
TLEQMARGGIHDHLGGGFARYAVDERWLVPHFEKMLYDNAQLLPLYALEAARTGEPLLLEAAEGIVGWLERDMLLPEGAFAASLDANS